MKKLLLLHLLLAMFLGAQTAGASVVLNATNFPDDNFRTYISGLTGVSVGSTISDATLANVKEISVEHLDISSLQGIEYFTELTELGCRDNQLTSLDVRWNTKLTSLACDYNQLTSLDLRRNTMLEQLYCGDNNLTSINVSNNTNLLRLNCSANQLTSLNVSNNIRLQGLYCMHNQLTSLNVSMNTELRSLQCYSNQLTSLDVSKNTNLTDLRCSANQLTSLNVSNNIRLQGLYCMHNQLTSLNVSMNTELRSLQCYSNQLTSLDVSKNTNLTDLRCDDNQLTSLDLRRNTKLEKLRCSHNNLTSLSVSNNIDLTVLYCSENQLTSLDVSKNTELEVLSCYSNKIDQLNLSNNTKLTELKCNDNYLTHLELDNTALTDRTAVDVGNQSSTRRFTVNSYGSDTNNCWTLFVNTTDASRIRALKIDGVSKTPVTNASAWLVVSEDLKKIPQKVEYEYDTGKDAARWMPVTVNYDVKRYGVYVAGEELTSLNFYDIPGLKEGTAYFYDESSGLGWSGIYPTLVLYDAKIEGEKGLYNKECYDLKIIARGNNSITATDWTGFDTDAVVKTTISGGGKLWITATGDRNGGIYNSDASTLKITDGTKVISQGDGYGFFDDGGTLYIQDNSILACYGNESASVELPVESKCKFDSNIGIRYPAGAYIGNSYHVFYTGTTTDVQRNWVVIGPDNQATQDLITDLTNNAQQHDYVDLGLPSGTLWATCNVGANSPEEYGDYFAWGETEPKSDYSWSTYKWCKGSENTFTKYCLHYDYGYNGYFDELEELLPEDDAATVNWGGEWQTPEYKQYEELFNTDYTTMEWTAKTGKDGSENYGMLITSKINGNSIFLPAGGMYYEGSSLEDVNNLGYYYSRFIYFPYNGEHTLAFTKFTNSGAQLVFTYRYQGLCVRPVRAKREVYTDFVAETGTLTYYYDDQMDSRQGTTELYNPGDPDAVRFTGYYKKVTKAVIDPSMKDAPLTSMRNMFYGGFHPETFVMQSLSNMTSIEGLENLNTSTVTDMNNMFGLCQSLTTLDLSSFNTSKVTTFNGMFQGCENLKMVDVSSFDISRVTDMGQMFLGCNRLTTICCANDWSRTTAASDLMFSNCSSLVGGNGTAYNSNFLDATYARPDGGTASPGYFTADTMTGIESIHNSQFIIHNEEAIYNLAGQRLSKTQRGINIVGGRKVVIK